MLRSGGPPAVTGADASALAGLLSPSQTATPNSGDNVQVNNNNLDTNLWLVPVTNPIASLTVTLPNNASSRIGQKVSIGTSKGVSSLTVAGAGTILNAPPLLQAGDLYIFTKVGNDTWALLL